MTARRRRGLLLLCVALASGGLAASQVREREQSVAEQVGPAVDVLVAARDLRAGARITRDRLALRRVPARFVPPDALASAAGVVGARSAVPLTAGAYVTAGVLAGGDGGHRGDEGIGRGRRAVTVEVVGTGVLGAGAPGSLDGGVSGTRVDVLVSTESATGGGRTVMALAGADLLRLDPAPGYPVADEGGGGSDAGLDGGGASAVGTALATLRVTLRQAVYLAAADNFAREIRLLARPAGDRAAAGVAVGAGEL